jgi:iron complex outermembrane receptor protein
LESLNYTNTSAGVYSKSKLHKQITQLVFQRDIARAHQLHLKLENNFSLADNASYVKEMPTQNNFSVLLKYTYDVKKINITVSANQQLIQSQLAPFLFETQVIYRPYKNIYIVAKGARLYRFPTLNDLYWNQGGQTDLQAEKGWSAEYSFFYGVTKNRFYFNTKATNFYYLINNKNILINIYYFYNSINRNTKKKNFIKKKN